MRALALWVPVPRTEVLDDGFVLGSWAPPVVVKPRRRGTDSAPRLVLDRKLLDALPRDGRLLVQEYLPGAEYVVDVLASRTGKVKIVSQRVIRAGELEPDDGGMFVELITRRIVDKLGLEGAPRLHFKRDRFDQPRLLHVTPRPDQMHNVAA